MQRMGSDFVRLSPAMMAAVPERFWCILRAPEAMKVSALSAD
jgi:hypothetical protein